ALVDAIGGRADRAAARVAAAVHGGHLTDGARLPDAGQRRVPCRAPLFLSELGGPGPEGVPPGAEQVLELVLRHVAPFGSFHTSSSSRNFGSWSSVAHCPPWRSGRCRQW